MATLQDFKTQENHGGVQAVAISAYWLHWKKP